MEIRKATGTINRSRAVVMTNVAETLESVLPEDMPEADPELVRLAENAFGYEAKD